MGRCWKHLDERLEGPECTVNGLSVNTRQDRPTLLQCECVTLFHLLLKDSLCFLCVETSFQDEGPAATLTSHLPGKAFWVSLSVSLLLVIIAISLKGHLGTPRTDSQVNACEAAGPPLGFTSACFCFCFCWQIVRITAPGQNGIPVNQSAVVDQKNDLVTLSLSSTPNRTSTVLFDIKHVRPVPFEVMVTGNVRPRALLIGCDVAGVDMLQTRGAGALLPAADGRDRLQQRALPPPAASPGNQCQH